MVNLSKQNIILRANLRRLSEPPQLTADELRGESEIVWLIDPREVDYVREITVHCQSSTKPPRIFVRKLAGYAVLRRGVRRDTLGGHRRRAFVIAARDRVNEPDGPYRVGAPAEAVDPLTTAPGAPGRLTRRALGLNVNKETQ